MSMSLNGPPRRGGTTSQTLVMIALAATVLALTFLFGALFGDNLNENATAASAQRQQVSRSEARTEPGQPGTNSAAQPAATPPTPRTPPTPSNPGPPPVRLEPAMLDLGVIRPQTKHEAVTHVINTGSEPLTILASRASCTCTAIDMSGTVIPPGGSAPLVATFDAQSSRGIKTSKVRLAFEGYTSLVEFEITADIGYPVLATPPMVHRVGNTSGQFIVESRDGRPFNILNVNGDPPPFVDFDPTGDSPRDRYVLSWDLSEYNDQTCLNAAGERMPAVLLIETDHPEWRLLDVEVRHICSFPDRSAGPPQWFARNRRVMLGTIPEASPTEFIQDVKWSQDAPRGDRIVLARSLSPQFDAHLVDYGSEGDEGHCLIRLTPKTGVRGVINGDVEMTSATGRTGVYSVIAYVE